MSKPWIGLFLGAFLGMLDGISSFFYPDLTGEVILIVAFSTLKGLITGFVAGLVARKWNSLPVGIATGLFVGLLLAYVASIGTSYFVEIMLPGSILGVIVGFATQRLGKVDPKKNLSFRESPANN